MTDELIEHNDYVGFSESGIIEYYPNRIWVSRGHWMRSGLLSPDQKYFFLNIPKNSSSFVKKCLTSVGWEYADINDYPEAKVIVNLRDPISRWISGIFEYLLLYHVNIIDNICDPYGHEYYPLLGEKLGLSLIFDKITFDDHTEKQCAFLVNLNLSDIIWLKHDKDFSENFSKLITDLGYPNNFQDEKFENATGEEFGDLGLKRHQFNCLMQSIIDADSTKEYDLRNWFWCDYKLIEEVKFYGT